MKNLRITTLFFIIYAVTIISLLLSLIAVFYVSWQKNILSEKKENRYISIRLAAEFLQASNFLTRNVRTYVANGDKKYKDIYWNIADIMDGKSPRECPPSDFQDYPNYNLIAHREKKALLDLMKEYGFTNEEFALLSEAKKLSDNLITREKQAMDLIEAKYDSDSLRLAKKAEALNLLFDSVYIEETRKIAEPVKDFFEKVMKRTATEANQSEYQLNLAIYILNIIIILNLLIGVISWLLMNRKVIRTISYISASARSIAKGNIDKKLDFYEKNELGDIVNSINKLIENLENSAKFIQKIEEGDFTAELTTTETEEVNNGDDKKNLNKSLKKMRDRLKEVAEDDKKRNWANEGFAKFGALLRENDDLNQLANQIVSELVNYIGVQQGALLILMDEEDQKWLEMLACYAYDRTKYGIEKKIKLGEGLVGQTFLEKKSLYMTNVPENYVHIESALGNANPRSILIVPLKINEQTVGVLELASFYPIETHVLDFVEKLAESIAGSISSVKVNEMTRRLLIQSQEQANLLQSSEEELRQNMEELQATQDAIQRNTHELTARINLIDDAGIASLEVSPKGILLDANTTFLRLLNYKQDELIGKNHTFLLSTEYANSNEYKEFWQKLLSGVNVESEFTYIGKDRQTIYIKGVYSVLKDLNGKTAKIVQLGTDITNFKLEKTK